MWPSSRTLFSQASSTNSDAKSWKQAFTSSLLATLGEEKVVTTTTANSQSESVASVAHSYSYEASRTSGGGGGGERSRQDHHTHNSNSTRRRISLPRKALLQDMPKDSVSVLTCDRDDDDNDDDYDTQSHKQPSSMERERLYQTQQALYQQSQVQTVVQAQALEEARGAFTKLQLTHMQQERQWAQSIEDLQYQKTILQERLGVLLDDVNNPELLEQLTHLIQDGAPKDLSNETTLVLPVSIDHPENNTTILNSAGEQEQQHLGMLGDNSNSVSLGFRSRWTASTSPRQNQTKQQAHNHHQIQQQQQQQIKALQDYAKLLQSHLVDAMHKVTTLSNQISTMEQAHEDQVSKIIHSIQESEMERIRIQVESDDKYQTLLHEKKMNEQVLLAKLNRKTEAVRRLEDHVEELRDAAAP